MINNLQLENSKIQDGDYAIAVKNEIYLSASTHEDREIEDITDTMQEMQQPEIENIKKSYGFYNDNPRSKHRYTQSKMLSDQDYDYLIKEIAIAMKEAGKENGLSELEIAEGNEELFANIKIELIKHIKLEMEKTQPLLC